MRRQQAKENENADVWMGRKLIGVIKQNYAWAIGFNTAGIALATAGLLSRWLAALFHHMSSVLVVLNSAGLVRDQGTGRERHSGRIATIPLKTEPRPGFRFHLKKTGIE